jgi:hypothetical protein
MNGRRARSGTCSKTCIMLRLCLHAFIRIREVSARNTRSAGRCDVRKFSFENVWKLRQRTLTLRNFWKAKSKFYVQLVPSFSVNLQLPVCCALLPQIHSRKTPVAIGYRAWDTRDSRWACPISLPTIPIDPAPRRGRGQGRSTCTRLAPESPDTRSPDNAVRF